MRRLPLDHAIRNIGRRPVRSLLTVLATALVAALLVSTSAFVRSLEKSHLATAPRNTTLLISASAMGDIVRSSMSPMVAELIAADVQGVLRVGGVPASSPEIHMGTDIRVQGIDGVRQSFVRGVTERAYLVHDAVTVIAGRLPEPGEALVGRLAAVKCGLEEGDLAIGRTVYIEGGPFRVAGTFAAPGTTVESEIWVSLTEIQGLSQRDDCSAVFVRVEDDDHLADVELFALRRVDLELVSIPAQQYYAELAGYFEPILALAWAMAAFIALAAMTSGANTMVASVQDRSRELATLRAVGFRGGALALTVLQESLVLGAAGALVGLLAARILASQASVSLAMTAFQLDVDAVSVLVGCAGILVVIIVGSIPALRRVLRLSVAESLKET
jgi:ABC-type antimicrobial peptide transport system permease subunit